MKTIAAALLVISLASQVEAGEIIRSAAAVREFKRTNVCPATNTYSQRCPGYVVDHVVPLCAGGADSPSNMQYQTVAAGKQKDKLERWICQQQRSCK